MVILSLILCFFDFDLCFGPHLRGYGTTRFLSSGAFRNGTSTRDNTGKEERAPANGQGHADQPAPCARAACASRSVGGVAEGRSIAARSHAPACRAGACGRPAGGSAYSENCPSGTNGSSGNRPLG